MSARETILGRVRAKLPKGPEGARREAVELHMAQHPRNLIPARGQGDIDHRIRVFTEMMLAVGGTVEIIDDINEVPHHVAVYLRDGTLPAVVRRVWPSPAPSCRFPGRKTPQRSTSCRKRISWCSNPQPFSPAMRRRGASCATPWARATCRAR